MKENIAWCPDCFDALETIEVLDNKGLIKTHIYYCFGCDKTFTLVNKEIISELKKENPYPEDIFIEPT